jgi:hypothetical protein
MKMARPGVRSVMRSRFAPVCSLQLNALTAVDMYSARAIGVDYARVFCRQWKLSVFDEDTYIDAS